MSKIEPPTTRPLPVCLQSRIYESTINNNFHPTNRNCKNTGCTEIYMQLLTHSTELYFPFLYCVLLMVFFSLSYSYHSLSCLQREHSVPFLHTIFIKNTLPEAKGPILHLSKSESSSFPYLSHLFLLFESDCCLVWRSRIWKTLFPYTQPSTMH